MMQTRLRLAAFLVLFGLAGTASAAEEAIDAVQSIPEGGLVLTGGSSKALYADGVAPRSAKALTGEIQPVRFAMCGVEADAGNADLDAGLIDFNNPDAARAGGRAADDKPSTGRNVPDYRSSVFLGMTVGYHF